MNIYSSIETNLLFTYTARVEILHLDQRPKNEIISNNFQFKNLAIIIIQFIAIAEVGKRMLSLKSNSTASSSSALELLRITPRSKCRLIKRRLEFATFQSPLAFIHHCPTAGRVYARDSEMEKPHSTNDLTPRFHNSHIIPADPARNKNSHILNSDPWHAEEEPISSGVPPPLALSVEVDGLEVEVELFVCDVLVEVSAGDAGITVVPTTATLVVVDSGVTVTGTTVVVEDVAAAWGLDVEVEDDVTTTRADDVEALEVETVVLILVLVVDVLVSPAAD